MPSAPRFTKAPLAATPQLERLLGTLGRRLWLLVSLRALGLAFAVLGLSWAWAFFADFILAVPQGVRRAHGVLLVSLPLLALWRTGIRHLLRLPDRRALAALLEERVASADLFTSAVDFQLTGQAPAPQSDAMVQRVYGQAEAAVQELRATQKIGSLGVLSARPMAQALAAGTAAVMALVTAFAIWPSHQEVFASRLFSEGAAWPQLTFLSIEIPLATGVTTQSEAGHSVIAVRLARGEDLPISVLCQGQVPERIELIFDDDSRRSINTASGTTKAQRVVFTTTLRAVSGDLTFVVEGGDDDRHSTRVTVTALTPPDLSELKATITPPTYSGLPIRTLTNSDLTVLAGSRIDFTAKTEPAGVTGVLRLLPEDRTLELASSEAGLSLTMTPERSLRMRFELLDPEGLGNPDPGLWSITVNPDRAPRVHVHSPEGLNLETTALGVLPLWVALDDDFALSSAQLNCESTGTHLPLELRPRGSKPGAAFAFASIPIERLVDSPEAGQTVWVQVEAADNRQPLASTGLSSKIALRVLSREDYIRRVQDRLASVRRRTSELFDLQREKRVRLQELLDGASRADLAAALSGQRRVEADSMSILRELTGICSDVLHARIDTGATGQLEQLDRLLAARVSADFDPALWETLLEKQRAGQLGTAGFAGHLLALCDSGYRVAAKSAPKARAALEPAPPEADGLESALELVHQNLVNIEALLGQLAEWDNFQSVLSLTREILERQRTIKRRTEDLATQ